MIVERASKNSVLVRWRTEDGKRATDKYSCDPFCYIEESNIGKLKPPFAVLPDEGYEGLYGEKLRRVVFQNTDDLSACAKKCAHGRLTLRTLTGFLLNTMSISRCMNTGLGSLTLNG